MSEKYLVVEEPTTLELKTSHGQKLPMPPSCPSLILCIISVSPNDVDINRMYSCDVSKEVAVICSCHLGGSPCLTPMLRWVIQCRWPCDLLQSDVRSSLGFMPRACVLDSASYKPSVCAKLYTVTGPSRPEIILKAKI